ncbi:MAG: low molecular weight phosphotyrosine protein phosphatase [Bacteroidales bacterium]|nr:low molecular weight phosphotyrosine protein phosphatase [Bacteroidales bacterium]
MKQETSSLRRPKTRILFVCHGNICRSPMAEFVMKALVANVAREEDFYIESAATSTEEIGNSVYPPARRKLAEYGISCAGKTARQVKPDDYVRFDLIVGMDDWNLRNLYRIFGTDPDGKLYKLLELVNPDSPRFGADVADPWYTGDFDATYRDVVEGCQAILDAHNIPS